jgi:hypothetical protein
MADDWRETMLRPTLAGKTRARPGVTADPGRKIFAEWLNRPAARYVFRAG